MKSSRTALIQHQMDLEHFKYRLSGVADDLSTVFVLRSEMLLCLKAPSNCLLQRAFINFKRFCLDSLSVNLIEGQDPAALFFWIDPEGDFQCEESFKIKVSEVSVEVSAKHERGLLHATHYLERMMTENGGAFLKRGVTEKSPALSPRFSEGMFIPGMQSPHDLGYFSDDYLGLISHYGTNAFKLYLNLLECWKSETFPKLNHADFDVQIEKIRAYATRLSEFGIDLYLQIVVPPIDADHPLFKIYPEAQGSSVTIFIKELEEKKWNNLCSGSRLVHQAYHEVIESIFRSAPELAGAIMIIGGECFFHCFTRPSSRGRFQTNCPHCQGKDPHQEVARLVNTVSRSLKSTGSQKRLMAWPYSSFAWTGDDLTQTRWIQSLDSDVEFLGNFDCNDADEKCGVNAHFWDYNIKLIGPSKVFAAQAVECRKKGIRYHVKTETNTTPETFFLPYIPVHYRWYDRFKAVRDSGASGFMGQWRFYGMNASLPEEIQYQSIWNPELNADDVLGRYVEREFGLKGGERDQVLAAWKKLSDAWDYFPHSSMTSGGLGAYMNGPWYLGPAHPLIFNTQDRYQLGKKFFLLRGDLSEWIADDEMRKVDLQPRYADRLFITFPFGVKKYLEFSRKICEEWSASLHELEQAVGMGALPSAYQELDICRTIGVHLQSLVHTIEFFEARDRLGQEFFNEKEFDLCLNRLEEIVQNEILNATKILPLLERDPRIGWGFCYGEVYDAEMVAEKIKQCRYVLEQELPRVRDSIRFHIWNKTI